MPNGDTPQIDWQNDPDFKGLPLAEKHKVLLRVDPDYKGLPAKEQMKVLDQVHYGPPAKSDYAFSMGPTVPRPPGGGEEAMLAEGAPPAASALTTIGTIGAIKTNPREAIRSLVGSAAGSYAGGHVGQYLFGEPGKIVGEIGGGIYGGYKGATGGSLPGKAKLLERLFTSEPEAAAGAKAGATPPPVPGMRTGSAGDPTQWTEEELWAGYMKNKQADPAVADTLAKELERRGKVKLRDLSSIRAGK